MPPKVDESKCDGCGNCVEECPNEVFKLVEKKSKVEKPEDCTSCELCVDACPNNALEIVD